MVLAALAYVALETNAYYIDVPFWDEWLLLPLLQLNAEGRLGWAHLLAPHNEHRPVVSRLVLLALARLTNWNLWHECMLVVALGIATVAALWAAVWRDDQLTSASRTTLLIVCGVTFLSMNQWENWLWGWQVKVMLTSAGVAWGSVFMAARPGAASVAAAVLCGVVATFSFGNGFLVWPAMAPAALALARRRWLLAILWLVAAAASIAFFLVGNGQPLELNEAMGSANVGRVVESSGRIVGTALAGTAGAGVTTAVGLLALAAAVLMGIRALRRATDDPLSSTALTLVLFGAATAILIAVGRQFGPGETIPARYMAFVNLFWIALAILGVTQAPRLAPVIVIVPVLATISGWQAREAYIGRHQSLMKWRASLYAPIDNPIVDRFFWAPGFVAPWLLDLRGLSYSLYDCTGQLPAADFDAAAEIVASHGRRDDLVITSSDWTAACLRTRLAKRRSGVTVVSVAESAAKATTALGGRSSAFLVSGGDVASADARRIVEGSGYPVYRSPVGSLRLFYFPGRIEYVRDRLTPDEVAADHAALTELGDIAHARDERFLLKGWLRWRPDGPQAQRTMVTRTAAVYVPVLRTPPATLTLDVSLVARELTPTLAVRVNGTPLEAVVIGPGTGPKTIALSNAAWRYGSNIVEFEAGAPGDDISRMVDDAPLVVFGQLRVSAANSKLQ